MPDGNPTADTSDSTSSSLLDGVKAHDPDAWSRLSKLYGPDVYAWARGAGLQDGDAADVVQEVFRAVATSIEKFRHDRPGDTFRGWLWAITRNCIRAVMRQAGKNPEVTGGTDAYEKLQQLPDAPPETSSSGESASGGNAIVGRALEMIRGDFEDHTWKAFTQTALDGRSPADVAADLGMSVSAVYAAKSRVLARLRSEFRDLL